MKRIMAFVCAALLMTTAAHGAELNLSAPSAVLMEKETGTVLYAKDEHAKLEPASVTKVMTLLLVMEAIDSGRLSYDDMVTGSAHACSMGGSQIWLKENEQLSVRDMLKAVCVVSANDCAVALGEHLCGSEEAFVEKMNQRARELGMNDTTFKNATGLPAEGHVTSAWDIALMSRELILNHPDIRQFTTIWMDTLRSGASSLVNTNKLVRFYDGATGLKTGSTDSALYCLSATAEREGMELIATIMKAPTSAQRFEDAKAMLNYGFGAYTLVHVTLDEVLPTVPVTLGRQNAVQPVLSGSSALLLPKEQAAGLEKTVQLLEQVEAPVEQGQSLGELTVTSGGETVATVPLIAGEAVERMSWGGMLLELLRLPFVSR
ncbi:D-alanyl-D-alanine carboxypeptidase [Oscillibacter sp. MSJ-2]|uniref:D-alanyl-D-alanine carboxypeptidase n=1 Tax=Dysosmobacter acutus TaxID=2841504 RepID=A0ABS6F631_9FIRM|nr:D-alanyl-D-alanine carboxypeptidase family protein [Dysosmobacter acutus]MBU5625716.1 D-alanyl-D-alanine carboxypeptidase [Dysosmobacter acutus]